MKALIKSKPIIGKDWEIGFKLKNIPIPKIKKGEVLIKVFAGAICGTDVGIYNSKDSLRNTMLSAIENEITIGHEFSGTFFNADDIARKILAKKIIQRSKSNNEIKKLIKNFTINQLSKKNIFEKIISKFNLTAEMHVTCGKCYQCRIGEKHVCQNTIIKGVHDNGAFAEFVAIPAENILLYLKNEIPIEIMAFMDALGNATHTVKSVEVKGKNILVSGCGVQGLMAIAIAKIAGAKNIFVTDASHENFTHEKLIRNRFKLAKKFGAKNCYDMAIDKEREQFLIDIKKITKGDNIDAVFEMSGNYSAYKDALSVLRMGGTFSLLGLPSGKMEIDFAKEIIFKGIIVKGIIGRKVFETWDQMEMLLKNGLSKKLISGGFVTHKLKLEEFEKAFQLIKDGEAYKILLKP